MNFSSSINSFARQFDYAVSVANNTGWEAGEVYTTQEESLSVSGLVVAATSVVVVQPVATKV